MYKLLTSYYGFYQKFGFQLIVENSEEDITKIMVSLAKKVSKYKIKDILENFREIIRFVEKYKNKTKIKYIEKWNKTINEKPLDHLKELMYNIGYLCFTMIPYKNYTFRKFIEIINIKKCFILSHLFEILSNIDYFEFSYDYDNVPQENSLEHLKDFSSQLCMRQKNIINDCSVHLFSQTFISLFLQDYENLIQVFDKYFPSQAPNSTHQESVELCTPRSLNISSKIPSSPFWE